MFCVSFFRGCWRRNGTPHSHFYKYGIIVSLDRNSKHTHVAHALRQQETTQKKKSWWNRNGKKRENIKRPSYLSFTFTCLLWLSSRVSSDTFCVEQQLRFYIYFCFIQRNASQQLHCRRRPTMTTKRHGDSIFLVLILSSHCHCRSIIFCLFLPGFRGIY